MPNVRETYDKTRLSTTEITVNAYERRYLADQLKAEYAPLTDPAAVLPDKLAGLLARLQAAEGPPASEDAA